MGEIIKKRYMIEITRYPNGAEFTKMWPIGEQKTIQNDFINKQKAKTQQAKQEKLETQKYTKGETIEM